MSDTNIPTDDFDFFMQLEDVNKDALSNDTKAKLQADHAQHKSKQEEVFEFDKPEEAEQYETPDWSFLEEGGDFDDGNTEEAEPEEDLEEAPEEDDGENEEVAPEGDYEEGDEDTVDVDLDTILTIHGKEYTAEELVSRYREDAEFEAAKQAFEAEREAFIADKQASADLIELNILECDREIADYKVFDWDWYALNDPAGYVENQRFLQRLENKKALLIKEQGKLLEEKQMQEDQAFRAKSQKCVEILEHEIPGWGEPLYQNLMNHAIDYYGADPAVVERWNDPSLFKILNDAYKAHNNILKAKASIKRSKVNGKFVRPGKAGTITANAAAQKARVEQAYASGKMSQEQAFAFLED